MNEGEGRHENDQAWLNPDDLIATISKFVPRRTRRSFSRPK